MRLVGKCKFILKIQLWGGDMWAILFVVTVGSVNGGVSATTFGSFNSAEVCQKVAVQMHHRFKESYPNVYVSCVQIKDKP